MKVRRMFILALAFSLFGTATVVASSLWGEYEGFDRAKLIINNTEKTFEDGETPAFITKGSTVLPVRSVIDSLQALVKWDNANKTVNIYKPNVHMVIGEKVSDDYSVKSPFGKVKKGKTISFGLFAQVDNLLTSVDSVKFSIVSPSGDQVVTPYEQTILGQKDNMWFNLQFNNVTFKESGNYMVKFAVKLDSSSEYTVVSEKVIVSE